MRGTYLMLGVLAAGVLCGTLPMPAMAAPQVIAPAAAKLELETSKGRLVRLDRPAASVFVADPDVADIQVKSPTLVYVIGQAAGETTLFAVSERHEILLHT